MLEPDVRPAVGWEELNLLTSDGNGYAYANVINWNAAVALQADGNSHLAPSTRRFTTGYSSMFNALFEAIVKLAKAEGVHFAYCPDTRLHSILKLKNEIRYTIATRRVPTRSRLQKRQMRPGWQCHATPSTWLRKPHAMKTTRAWTY